MGKRLLKKTYIYYIYNIIKRNTQGLVSLIFTLSIVWWKTPNNRKSEDNTGAGIRQEWRRPAFWKLAAGKLTQVSSIRLYTFYVSLRVDYVEILLILYWRQFSKSWTPSFLPYSCSWNIIVGWQFRVTPLSTDNDIVDTNPCVFLFIILYIVNVCFFE